MSQFDYDYSKVSDILHIQKAGKKTKGSVELGDFTLDFGTKDELVGVEIEHASEFFINLDIEKDSLQSLQHAEFVIDNRNPQSQLIILKLQMKDIERKIPVPLPVVS
tara:strand:- start:3170 stop:3490 length:321 start_codon:yes stop_codon:yes gene_type:complete